MKTTPIAAIFLFEAYLGKSNLNSQNYYFKTPEASGIFEIVKLMSPPPSPLGHIGHIGQGQIFEMHLRKSSLHLQQGNLNWMHGYNAYEALFLICEIYDHSVKGSGPM